MQNQNCRQILLGISHDAGYAPFLDEILRDQTTRQRVSILEGVPTMKDLRLTGVNIFTVNSGLFRTEKLADRSDQLVDRPLVSSMMASPKDTPATSVTPPQPTPPLSTHGASPFSSYSTMAQKVKPASPPPQITMPLAPRAGSATSRPKQMSSQPKWNPGPRGLDKPIPINPTVLDAVKKRKENNKLCNNHFLRGPCAKIDTCPFVHNYRPSPDEIHAIAWLSRLNPCTTGQDCEADGCIYGHHVSYISQRWMEGGRERDGLAFTDRTNQCPNLKDDTCTHPYCKFPVDAHPPGTKFKNPHIDKNY